jgi:hypothetical protein
MYVVTDHNNQNFVILGPVAWKPRYIGDIISDEIQEDVTVTQADEIRVPFDPYPGITIRRATAVYEPITNDLIQVHQGPTWTYDDENPETQATATWIAVDRDIREVRSILKNKVADLRWKKENAGITLTIQGVEVWCDTSRGNRDIFLQKFMLMGENDTVNWKFPNVWLNLTKNDLGQIVSAGGAYIQSCFDWEQIQNYEIDACETLAELAALVFEEPSETPNGFEVI